MAELQTILVIAAAFRFSAIAAGGYLSQLGLLCGAYHPDQDVTVTGSILSQPMRAPDPEQPVTSISPTGC